MGINPYTKKPWCYGHPNECCGDCEYFKECMKILHSKQTIPVDGGESK